MTREEFDKADILIVKRGEPLASRTCLRDKYILSLEQQLANLNSNLEAQGIMLADYKKHIEELENATIPFLTMAENRALRKRIEELETPKSCEGCKYYTFGCNRLAIHDKEVCIRIADDYYEPKDKQ